MAWGRIRTEHCGAKRGKGYWGRKAEAKAASKRARRCGDSRAASGITVDELDQKFDDGVEDIIDDLDLSSKTRPS